jgi:hypothetical protein
MVRNHFGTMSAAVRAAGLTPRPSPSRARRHLRSSDSVLDAIRAWNERYGEPPAMTDWDPARARAARQDWRIARFYAGDWPSIATVRYHFGTLNEAVEAAGLIPRRPGQQPSQSVAGAGAAAPTQSAAKQVLALRIKSVASADSGRDDILLIEALNDLAMAAFSWADELRSHPRSAASGEPGAPRALRTSTLRSR